MKKRLVLNEASLNWLEQEAKMYAWHRGSRGANVGSMNDAKLKMNYDICVQHNWSKEATILNNEAIRRGLSWAQTQTATSASAPVQKNNLQFTFTVNDFWGDIAEFVRDSSADDIIKSVEPTLMKEQHLFIDLVYAIILKCEKPKIDALKDYLVTQFGMDTQTVKDNIKNILSDQAIQEKLNSIISLLNESIISSKLVEKIVKKGSKWQVQSEKGRNMGTYDTKDEAKKRLQQIEYFKHLSEKLETHKTLNLKLWNKDNTLKTKVAKKINLIVDEFIDDLKENEITFNLKDIVIVGSNCSYNYTKDSDLDIHLIAENIQAPEDLYNKIYSAYRSIFNKKLDIEFYGIPVEIFIEMDDTLGVYNGVYSVMNNKWLQEPVIEDIPEIDQESFEKELKNWEDRYKKIIEMNKNS